MRLTKQPWCLLGKGDTLSLKSQPNGLENNQQTRPRRTEIDVTKSIPTEDCFRLPSHIHACCCCITLRKNKTEEQRFAGATEDITSSDGIEKVTQRRESDRCRSGGGTFSSPMNIAYIPTYGTVKRPRPFVAEALLHNSLWDAIISYQVRKSILRSKSFIARFYHSS